MKKILILLVLLLITISLINNNNEYVVIPNESIRFRIIPNSNSIEDILMKEKVKDRVSTIVSNIEKSSNIEETRNLIQDSIPLISQNINTLFSENDYNKDFKINYGFNYFPEKNYKGIKYEEGNYESLVIEIGEASGSNYWCVLFPPLCMIEEDETSEVEYKFFIKEIIDKFLNI